jgi:hypothetical protein
MHSVARGGLRNLNDAAYFRRRAERTRGLLRMILQLGVRETLSDLARDYDELAEDLERSADTARHLELLRQRLP